MEKIITECYGIKDEWDDRQKAMAYFLEGMMCCEGVNTETKEGRIMRNNLLNIYSNSIIKK